MDNELSQEELDKLFEDIIATSSIKQDKVTEEKKIKDNLTDKKLKDIKGIKTEAIKMAKLDKEKIDTSLNLKNTLRSLEIRNTFDNLSMDFMVHYLKNTNETFEQSWKSFEKSKLLTDTEAKAINHKLKPRIERIFNQLDLSNPKYKAKKLTTNIGSRKIKNKVLFDTSKNEYVIPTTSNISMKKENKMILSILGLFKDIDNIRFVGPSKKTEIFRVPQADKNRVGYREKTQKTFIGELGLSYVNESPIKKNENKIINSIRSPRGTKVLGEELDKYYEKQNKLKKPATEQVIGLVEELTKGMDYKETLEKLRNTTVEDLKHVNRFAKGLKDDPLSLYSLDNETPVAKFLGKKELFSIAKRRTKEAKEIKIDTFHALIKKVMTLAGKRGDNLKAYKKEIDRTLTNKHKPTKRTFELLNTMENTLLNKKKPKQLDKFFDKRQSLLTGIPEKDLFSLRYAGNPSRAAKVMLSEGIPKDYKPLVAENMVNTQGNTRKDLLTQILRHTLNGNYSEEKAKESLKFIGEHLDEGIYKLIQDGRVLELNKSLSRLMERSETSSVKEMKKRLSFAIRNLSIGYEDGPNGLKGINTPSPWETGLDGVKELNFLTSKEEKSLINELFGGPKADSPSTELAELDKKENLNLDDREKLDLDKTVKEPSKGYSLIGMDETDKALEEVLKDFGPNTTVDKAALTEIMKIDPKIKTSRLTDLLRKVKHKRASVGETLQIVKLAKSLGFLSKNTDKTIGADRYISAIKALENFQAEYAIEKGFQSIGVKFNRKLREDVSARATGGVKSNLGEKINGKWTDLGALKLKGRQYFNPFDRPLEDIAYTRRQDILDFISMDTSNKANKLKQLLRSEMEKIVKGKANLDERSLTIEENKLALEIERLEARYGSLEGIPSKKLSVDNVVDYLYKIRNPEPFVTVNTPRNVSPEDLLTKSYNKHYLRKVELKYYAATTKGRENLDKIIAKSLGVEDITAPMIAKTYIPKFKQLVSRLVSIGKSRGISPKRINKTIETLGAMSKGLHGRPFDFTIMDGVLNSTAKLITAIGNGKDTKNLFDNPEDTLASFYSSNKLEILKDIFKDTPLRLKEGTQYNIAQMEDFNHAGSNSDLYFLKRAGLGKDKEYADMFATDAKFDFGEVGKRTRSLKSYEDFIESMTTKALQTFREGQDKRKHTSFVSPILEENFVGFQDNKLTDEEIKKTLELNQKKDEEIKLYHKGLRADINTNVGKENLDRLSIEKRNKELLGLSEVQKELLKARRRITHWAFEPYSKRNRLMPPSVLQDIKRFAWSELFTKFHRFATGGYIPGKSIKDEVPALLMKGEAVLNQDTVKSLGINSKEAFKRFEYAAKQGKVKGFEEGGLTEEEKKKARAEALEIELRNAKEKKKKENITPKNVDDDIARIVNEGLLPEEQTKGVSVDSENKETASNINKKTKKTKRIDKGRENLFTPGGDNEIPKSLLIDHSLGKINLLNEGKLDYESLKATQRNINRLIPNTDLSEKQRESLAKLQRDLFVKSFEENDPMKAIAQKIAKDHIKGKITPATEDAFNKLNSIQQESIRTNLNSLVTMKGFIKGLKKTTASTKDLSDHFKHLNSDTKTLSRMLGITQEEFNSLYKGGLGKRGVIDFINRLEKRGPYAALSGTDAKTTQKIGNLYKSLSAINNDTLDTEGYTDRQAVLDIHKQEVERKRYLQGSAAGRFANFKEQMINNAAFMGSYAVLGAGTAILGAGLHTVVGLQDRLKNLQAITGATNSEMVGLTGSIKHVAVNTKFSAAEISDAATVLGQAGYSANSIGTALSGVVKLATATGSSLEDSTQTITSALTIWDKSFVASKELANEFTAAVNKSKLDINSLGLALQYSGNIAAQGNIPVEDVLTLTSLMKNAGIKRGSTLGTGQRLLFSDIIAPSAKFVKSLDRANISLTEFRKTFESKGVIGVFKFLKKQGYGFQDASRGMQIRERTAYAAIINNIDKADAFKSSIVGTTAAEDANKVQMSSTLNRAKNMVNSWGIALSEGTKDTLDNLGNMFRVFTLDNKQKSKKFIYNSKAQLDQNLHPIGDNASSFTTARNVGLGIGLTGLALIKSKAIRGFLTEGGALGKVATTAKDLGKSAKNLTTLSGALGAGKGLLGTLKSLGKYGGLATTILGPGLDALDAANTYNKTKDSTKALRTFAADLIKDILPTLGAGIGATVGSPTGVGAVVGGFTGFEGGKYLNQHLGVNALADIIAGKNTGTNQMRVIEQLASEGEAYKQFETNLAKSRKTLRKDKSLNILPEDTQSEKNLKNAMAFRKALALSIAYGPKINQINNTLQNTVENSVSLMKNITEGSNNIAEQLKANMDAVAFASQKAREVKQKVVSDYLLNTKVNTNPTANMLDTIGKFKNIDEFKRYILGGKETQSFLKLANVNPQLVTKDRALIKSYVEKFITSSFGAYKGTGIIDKKALTKALMDRIDTSAFSGALGGTEGQMRAYIKAMGGSKGIPSAAEKIKVVTEAMNEKILERVGYTAFKSDLNSIEADADKLGTTLSKTFKKINTTLQDTFVSESRRLGPQIQSFVSKISTDSMQLFKEIKSNAAFKSQMNLERSLGGETGLTSFYNTNDQRLGKVILDSNLYKTKALGQPGYFNVNADVTAESKALGLLDVSIMKKIDNFVKNMKWPKELKDATNLLQYNYVKSRNTTLTNSGISEESLSAFNNLTNADVLNSLPSNRSSFRNLFSKDYQAKIDFKRKIAIENMDIRVANIKQVRSLELQNRFKAMDVQFTNTIAKMQRQFQFNLESIDISANRSRREARISYSQNVAAFNRRLAFQRENINIQANRSREDLRLFRTRQIANLNLAADRSRQDLLLSLTRRTEALNKNYNRNLEKLNLSIERQTELANINLARSRQQAYLNFNRGMQSLNTQVGYSRQDAYTNYNRQVKSLKENYARQIKAIETAMADTQALFDRNLQRPVTLNIDGNALLKVANNLNDVSLALAANKAILNTNTSAIKQWININKTKEDVVKSAYKEAYKASGGNVNSAIFNKTYNDYLDKNSDKIIDTVVSQSLDKAFSGFDFDINKALTSPDYLKNQVANPGTSVTAEAAATGNGVTSQTLVNGLYGIQNGSYRTTTTEGAIAQASGKLPAALFDLNTAMIKFNLDIRNAGTKLNYSLDDAAKALSYSLTDISTAFGRESQALSLNLSRNLQDISTKFSQAMQDLQTQAQQQKEDLATSKSQALEDLRTNFNNAITDLGTNLDRKMQDLNTKFDQGMEDINTNVSRKLTDLNNSAAFSLNEMRINFNEALGSISRRARDMKEDLQRQLSFNLSEAQIDNAQNKQALQTQFDNLIESLDLQTSQAKKALDKQINDTFASATLNSLAIKHKFEKAWNDGLAKVTFNAVVLHNKLQESLNKAGKKLADSTSILSKQIAGSISLLFKSPAIVKALKQMGYTSEQQVIAAFSHLDFSKLKKIILSEVQKLNQISGDAASQVSFVRVSNALMTASNDVKATSSQVGNQLGQSSVPIVRGFQSLAQVIGQGAIQTARSISNTANQVIQQMTRQNIRISNLANSVFSRLQSTPIPGHTLGGVLPGYGGGDIVPAMLEPGEAIVTKEVVKKLGADFFNSLNRGVEVNKLLSMPTAQIRTINNSNQNVGGNNYFNISIPVAPDATLNTIERNIPTIADKVKQVFEEYL